MNLFRKLTSALTDYLTLYGEVGSAITQRGGAFLRSRWQRFLELPIEEKGHAVLTMLVVLFTFLPWRGYAIQFGDSEPRKHGIYSDDFAIILVGCLISLLPHLWRMLPNEPHFLKNGALYRYSGISIVALFALLNWFFPTRIAQAAEASFTWSFFVFEAVVAVWVVTGVLGAKCYAQYPVKN
ncbi:MAG TPA: hypothetical protein PLY93_11300 [Turneriella sp.]|nr:hypothetical protein [Turneriella sp.]